MASAQLKHLGGTWVFLGAVSGVQLTPAVNHEFRIVRTTLVSGRYLPARRRRFGIDPSISRLRKRSRGALDRFFKENQVLCTFRETGTLTDIQPRVSSTVRDELAVLAASQLGFSPRKSNATPSLVAIAGHQTQECLFLNVTRYGWTQSNIVVGRWRELVLDQNWKGFAEKVFFTKMLRILRGQVQVAPSWKHDLRNALVLIGQSQSTIDLPKAFLWNMIALELLLTRRQERVVDELPRRAEAFIGWAAEWQSDRYSDFIKEAYEKRNALVHQGERDAIKPRDVVLVDQLLLNVLVNIVDHPRLFSSKKNLIEFSRKVEAERTLGLKSRVRPRTRR